jgi:hypothetical protein
VRKAGLDLLSHQLRHTFVSLWVAAGANAKGSASGRPLVGCVRLDRDGHLYHDQDDVIADRLDDLLGQSKAAPARRFTRWTRDSGTADVSTVCPDEDNEPKAEAS